MVERQRNLTVLVVDNDAGSRETIRAHLSHFPNSNIQYPEDIREFADESDAYESIKKSRSPDILFVDVGLDTPGDKLLEKLVKEKCEIPTFVLSAAVGPSLPMTEQLAKSIYYSHRMYTLRQRAILRFKTTLYVEELVDQIRDKHRQLDFDHFFTVLIKPFESKDLLNRFEIIQNMLYRNPSMPYQS